MATSSSLTWRVSVASSTVRSANRLMLLMGLLLHAAGEHQGIDAIEIGRGQIARLVFANLQRPGARCAR